MRPQTFDEIVGQDEAVAILKHVAESTDPNEPRVFLLEGQFGAGKTTAAYVFAKSIGCSNSLGDIQILDASKDRSIDNIRAFVDMWGTYPMKRGAKGRVYIIDEMQGLTPICFEALLRNCENVPPSTYVFFCTTDSSKMPKPLKSRCKILPIKPLSPQALYKNMKRVVAAKNINITDDALQEIALNSEHSARISLQILENYTLNGGDVKKAIEMQSGFGDKLTVDTITLCRAIVSKRGTWEDAVSFIKAYTGQDETVRLAVLGYLNSCILGSKSAVERGRLLRIAECFINPIYNAGKCGLTYMIACAFEVK
jgi:DNA polymerase III gamma/tau subunit